MILEKKFLQALVRRKNCMQHKCNRKLMGKRGKNILPTRLLEKNILDDQKSPGPPLPLQELNGRPLSEERKIAQKVKFARIVHD